MRARSHLDLDARGCFEPMTAPVNALRSGEGLRFAEPGSAFTAEWSLEVRNAVAAAGTEAS